jgi:hypothetical protein
VADIIAGQPYDKWLDLTDYSGQPLSAKDKSGDLQPSRVHISIQYKPVGSEVRGLQQHSSNSSSSTGHVRSEPGCWGVWIYSYVAVCNHASATMQSLGLPPSLPPAPLQVGFLALATVDSSTSCYRLCCGLLDRCMFPKPCGLTQTHHSNALQDISGSHPNEVPRVYFPLRPGNKVTLYHDAVCTPGPVPGIALASGGLYSESSCWDDIYVAVQQAERYALAVLLAPFRALETFWCSSRCQTHNI